VCLSSGWVRCVSFKPDNPNILVSGSNDKTIIIWDITSGSCLSTLRAHSNWVRAVAWSPCGQWLASGGDDRMIFIYDANTFEVKSSLTGHRYFLFPDFFRFFFLSVFQSDL
jgi:WD40 repeat protein